MIASTVIVLQIFFNYDRELCESECRAIERRLGGKPRKVMHDKRHLGFTLVTDETPSELLERMQPALEVDAISNYWALVPTAMAASKFGGLDSLTTAIDQAYAIVYKRTRPKTIVTAGRRRPWRAA